MRSVSKLYTSDSMEMAINAVATASKAMTAYRTTLGRIGTAVRWATVKKIRTGASMANSSQCGPTVIRSGSSK